MGMERRRLLQLTGAALAAALLSGLPARTARACRVFPLDGEIDFLVLRHGTVIGTHRIRFARAQGRFVVRSDVEIEAGVPGAPLLRFVHHAEEVWVDGWLHAIVSDTDDDGRRYRLRAERRDGIFQGSVNGRAFTLSGYIIPTSFWHRDTPASGALFDTIDGMVKIVRPRLIGAERVPVGGKQVLAKHYALSGAFRRELWYDADCNLVRVAWLARDGSQIVLEPR